MKILFYYFMAGDYNDMVAHYTTNYGFTEEMRCKGHTVIIVNPVAELGASRPRELYDEFIVERVKKENSRKRIDLFFSSVRGNEMGTDAIMRIRKLGIKTVNGTWDNILVPHRVKAIAKTFDICWVHEPEAVATIKGYGARIFHAPVAANPYLYYPCSSRENIDVSFCGQLRESRPMYVEELFNRGIHVELYGGGWRQSKEIDGAVVRQARPNFRQMLRHVGSSIMHKHGRTAIAAAFLRRLHRQKIDPETQALIASHAHGPLSFPEMVKLFSRSKIALGFNELNHTYLLKRPLYQVRLRDFEAPMSGACYITNRMSRMQEHFDEDKEMLFYSSVAELVDKIRFYLHPRNDNQRAKIKRKARERALQCHTWSHRFSRLFKELELN